MYRTILTLLIAVAVASPALAQLPGSTKGFALMPHLNGSAWTIPGLAEDVENGGGGGLAIAYGINELIQPFIQADYATINPEVGSSYGLTHVDLGSRFNFLSPQRRFRLHAIASLSGFAAQWNIEGESLETSGGGLNLGGGLGYFFTPSFALDLNLSYLFGKLNEVSGGGMTIETDESVASSRFNLGVVWYPGR